MLHVGPPQQLMTDEGRGELSDHMVAWIDDLIIKYRISPGEAQQRLRLVDRKHQVFRKAIELYLEDQKVESFDAIRQALTYIMPQFNSQMTVAGYNPTQSALNYQPQVPAFLFSEEITPQHLSHGTSFEESLHKWNSARTAIMEADTNRKIRRALLRRHASQNQSLAIG